MRNLEFVSAKREAMEVAEPLSVCAQAFAAHFCGIAVREVTFVTPDTKCVLVMPKFSSDKEALARIIRFVKLVGLAAESSIIGADTPEYFIAYVNEKDAEWDLSPREADLAFRFFELNQSTIVDWTYRLIHRTPQVLGFIYPAQPFLREFEIE